MKQERIKVRLTKDSPYGEYGYYKRGDIGYIDGYSNGNAIIIFEDGRFGKADLHWIEVADKENKNLFPELAESEDERIRKEIMELIMQPTWKTEKEFHRRNELCTWLEKQGEQKPIGFNIGDEITVNGQVCKIVAVDNPAWSEGDEENLNWFEKFFRAESVIAGGEDIPQDRYLWLLSFKDRVQPQPKQEWSENDKRIIDNLISQLGNLFARKLIKEETKDKYVNWLKSIRPQSQWKPSDEQMDALNDVVSSRDIKYDVLSELWKDLKKLIDE